MNFDDKKIAEILLSENYVKDEDIKKAEAYAVAHRASVTDYLFTQGLLTKDLLGQALAEFFNVAYADLNTNQPSHSQVMRIPEDMAKKFKAVVYEETDREVVVATADPSDKSILEELRKVFLSKKISIAYSVPEDIEASFVNYQKTLDTRFGQIIQEQKKVAPEIIDEIIGDAFVFRASDIHFEPEEMDIIVRFRIDGVLHEAGRIPKEYYDNILNRIKVQSRLRIDEHYSAQDGAIRYQTKEGPVDLRVSIAPTLNGEKVVIRLLAEYVRSFALSDLGLTPINQNIITDAAKKPFGMILVSGPTGSGKTTTLYGILKVLNRPEVNITTIEDPVEYKMVGVNHIQVNEQTNVTFAEGLKSILRQDPDIILVGEIRDKETAEIAVNAALTGHLLLSTFHANDAATAIPRLLDMGVEPFLLASTMELIVSQRLVRRICENCRRSVTIKTADIEKILPSATKYFKEEKNNLYEGKGCEMCSHTGFKGRTAIFEFIRITPAMKELILKNPPTAQIWKLARTEGSTSLFEDGIGKVMAGITTIEELLRVSTPPEE